MHTHIIYIYIYIYTRWRPVSGCCNRRDPIPRTIEADVFYADVIENLSSASAKMVGHGVETYAKRMKGKRFSAMLVRKLPDTSSFFLRLHRRTTFFLFSFFFPSTISLLLFENRCNGRSITLQRSYLYLMKSASSFSSPSPSISRILCYDFKSA